MKALAILLLCAPLMAAELEGDKIKLSPDEMRQCVEGGGCVVVTVDVLRRLAARLQTCRRDAI